MPGKRKQTPLDSTLKALKRKRATKKASKVLLAEVNAAVVTQVEAVVEEEAIIVKAEIHVGAEQHAESPPALPNTTKTYAIGTEETLNLRQRFHLLPFCSQYAADD